MCPTCHHYGLCAPDCPVAPWNTELNRNPSPFVFLLRQRRWAKWPVARQDTWFMDDQIRLEQERRFFG